MNSNCVHSDLEKEMLNAAFIVQHDISQKALRNNHIMIIEGRPVRGQTPNLNSISQGVWDSRCYVIIPIFWKPGHREFVKWHSKVLEPGNGQGTLGTVICLPPESFALHAFSTGSDTLQPSSCETAVHSVRAEPVHVVQVTKAPPAWLSPTLGGIGLVYISKEAIKLPFMKPAASRRPELS